MGISLRRNFTWNLAGNIVYAACQWCMLIILAKLTSPGMVGRFALGLAVTAPIIMLSQLQLRGIQATDAKNEYSFNHYLGLRLISTAVALMVIAGVVAVGGYTREVALVIMAVGVSKVFESVSDVYYGLMQRHERMDRIAKSRMLKGPLSLVALGIMVFFTGEVLWGVIGLAATWGLLLIIYDVPNAFMTLREARIDQIPDKVALGLMRPDFNSRTLLRLIGLALPLGIVMALVSLQTNIPRYVIERAWGVGDLGIFAALAYLIVAGSMIVSAMGQSVVPRMANYYAAGDIGRYKYLLVRMVGIGFFLGFTGVLVTLIAGRLILTILYRPEYAEYTQTLVWLMVAGGVSYIASFLGYGMTAARYFRVQLPLFVLVDVVIYASSIWLIPRYALIGAAFALAFGALVQVLGSCLVVLYALRQKTHERTA